MVYRIAVEKDTLWSTHIIEAKEAIDAMLLAALVTGGRVTRVFARANIPENTIGRVETVEGDLGLYVHSERETVDALVSMWPANFIPE